MRKAEKRRIGREKFEKDMADSKAHGLRMQVLDRKRREQQLKDTLVQRDVKNLQHVNSKVSKSQKERDAIRKNDHDAAKALVLAAFDPSDIYKTDLGQDLIDRTDEDAGEMEFGCGIGA